MSIKRRRRNISLIKTSRQNFVFESEMNAVLRCTMHELRKKVILRLYICSFSLHSDDVVTPKLARVAQTEKMINKF